MGCKVVCFKARAGWDFYLGIFFVFQQGNFQHRIVKLFPKRRKSWSFLQSLSGHSQHPETKYGFDFASSFPFLKILGLRCLSTMKNLFFSGIFAMTLLPKAENSKESLGLFYICREWSPRWVSSLKRFHFLSRCNKSIQVFRFLHQV